MISWINKLLLGSLVYLLSHQVIASSIKINGYVLKSGDPTLQVWLLPEQPPYPDDNAPNTARIELGKALFFDTRLSGDRNMSCATCHNPMLGWSDGLPTAIGFRGQVLPRATPTVLNTAYNFIQMWDGRKRSLEHQVMSPLETPTEMHSDIDQLFQWLNQNAGYRKAFSAAYPGKNIDARTFSKAIAAFERTVISNNSAFDRWVKGEKKALTKQQIRGFGIFLDPDKGNCAACHQAPNFTDDGFHNLGLASFGKENPDLGRYNQKPLSLMKGAFKTPTLREIALTAPYFHDGSANTLLDVINFYVTGGIVKTNLSPNLKPLILTEQDKQDLIAFLQALTSEHKPVTLPQLPMY